MPDIITVSATEARRNFFELFNQVYYGKKTVIVKKTKTGGKVKIIADTADLKQEENMEDFIKETYGCLADDKRAYWPYGDKKTVKKQIKLQREKLKDWL